MTGSVAGWMGCMSVYCDRVRGQGCSATYVAACGIVEADLSQRCALQVVGMRRYQEINRQVPDTEIVYAKQQTNFGLHVLKAA